jgi:hypothetical protein
MKDNLEELTERNGGGAEMDTDGEGEDAQGRRKQAKLTGQVGVIPDLVTEDIIIDAFGT